MVSKVQQRKLITEKYVLVSLLFLTFDEIKQYIIYT